LRLRTHGNLHKRVTIIDEIRGKIEMLDNYLDIVLLKSDGIPTYHFAHAVDDFLMGTTHVIRGDEWLPSLPLHLQLFKAIEVPAPKYAHIAPLMKTEDGNKRKLSKRKDPEANVIYFFEKGYPKDAIKDYLLNIADSGFEKWREENPTTKQDTFPIVFSHMPKAGALFDMKKLESISHGYLSRLSNEELFENMENWAKEYD
jgi:glutamyl-tRNA synthetase